MCSQESEITTKQNLFDIRFSQAQLDKSVISKMLNVQSLMTFLSCDFYDHDSKESE